MKCIDFLGVVHLSKYIQFIYDVGAPTGWILLSPLLRVIIQAKATRGNIHIDVDSTPWWVG
jgi:hypothetical protein